MIEAAVAAFVGCLAAMIVLAEVQMASKWVRYLVALIVGLVLTIVLALVLGYVQGLIARA